MKSRPWILTLLVSALAAALVWALSPGLAGHREPWDAPGHYYPLGLVLAGLVSGCVGPRVIWAYFVGAVTGQLLYMLIFLKTGPLIAIGVLLLCLYGLVFLASALLAEYLRKRVLP